MLYLITLSHSRLVLVVLDGTFRLVCLVAETDIIHLYVLALYVLALYVLLVVAQTDITPPCLG